MRRRTTCCPCWPRRPDRAGRDRLEILTALISGAVVRPAVPRTTSSRSRPAIRSTGGNAWSGLRAAPHGRGRTCAASTSGTGRSAERRRASAGPRSWRPPQPLDRRAGAEETPAGSARSGPPRTVTLRLCQRHLSRWDLHQRTAGQAAGFAQWLSQEQPSSGYGAAAPRWSARTWPIRRWACAPGTAAATAATAARAGPPCRAAGGSGYERRGEPVPVGYGDEQAFRRWCAAVTAQPLARAGQPARAAAAGAGRDPVGPVRAHPAGTAGPVGPGLDPGPW